MQGKVKIRAQRRAEIGPGTSLWLALSSEGCSGRKLSKTGKLGEPYNAWRATSRCEMNSATKREERRLKEPDTLEKDTIPHTYKRQY